METLYHIFLWSLGAYMVFNVFCFHWAINKAEGSNIKMFDQYWWAAIIFTVFMTITANFWPLVEAISQWFV